MEKYMKAFERVRGMAERLREREESYNWKDLVEGIIYTAIYDNEIGPEEFDKILEESNKEYC